MEFLHKTSTLRIKTGQHLVLPVRAGHPLALFQTSRYLTWKDLVQHPVYSRVYGAWSAGSPQITPSQIRVRELSVRDLEATFGKEMEAAVKAEFEALMGGGDSGGGGLSSSPSVPSAPGVISTILTIGPMTEYQFPNISVEDGGTLSFAGAYHSVTTGNCFVHAGGTIRVYCDDPTVSATLVLNCQQFGQEA